MDERDFYGLAALILALGIIGIIHSRILREHQADIRYLMDNTVSVTRETEASL